MVPVTHATGSTHEFNHDSVSMYVVEIIVCYKAVQPQTVGPSGLTRHCHS